VAPKSLIIEVTGDEGNWTHSCGMLKQFGIKEIVRTGTLALGEDPR